MQRITTKNATKVCCWEGVISLLLRESEDDQMSETQPGHKSLTYHTMDLGIHAAVERYGDLWKILILAFSIT